ncbi:MAG: Hsp20/alpha crystallin family protein [Desulfobacter postgatei]|jgi:HSP20 family protein|uniref:Molecular chaperone (Small heat shock protein) n=1 Tax=Desulfobacter postgatei 2ac9 TaxID=879212 RepID=I5AYB0_9BACT|nr:Hsp20/alpha crystallin family protein [Desulfobacter postgatei]EIM62223.1 molecular chaperone (small heat shock protein) [Desulfobacter postgatei 2ac9]MDD4274891.1 Hsp20/alpha crystallin family protein [Desulfobacter postgatei]MDX9965058.1 Hsp20/alpha crystallin family protein [Desulfobacter postgatei]
MNIKKWVPWNWFKKEEEDAGKMVPVAREKTGKSASVPAHPLEQFHQEIDQLFDRAFRGFGLSPFSPDQSLVPTFADGILKPTLDLGATDKEYTVTVEIPGVDEKDVKLEIINDTLTISGEKKQEKEEKEKNFYRMERSYGSFQRILSLPEDADQDKVKATFKTGVLTVTMPRKALPKSNVKQIEVKTA